MKKIIYVFAAILFTVVLGGCSKDNKSTDSTSGEAGQGGSLARYTIANGYLYMVDMQELKAFSLANPTDPILAKTLRIGSDIETIFAFEDKLFIGSMQAMYIYSITNPSSPQKLGEASHVRACDPVIANQDYAYVTVRSGTACGGNTNALYIYDVKNILNPTQVNVVPMSSPYGLGKTEDVLYVCDGGNGLQIFDITDPVYPSRKNGLNDEIFYDVIVDETNDLLICMVQGGTAIYRINDFNLEKLAKIVN